MKNLLDDIVAWRVDEDGVYRAVFERGISNIVEQCRLCGSAFPRHRCHMWSPR